MNFCTQCGAPGAGAAFCTHCGTRLDGHESSAEEHTILRPTFSNPRPVAAVSPSEPLQGRKTAVKRTAGVVWLAAALVGIAVALGFRFLGGGIGPTIPVAAPPFSEPSSAGARAGITDSDTDTLRETATSAVSTTGEPESENAEVRGEEAISISPSRASIGTSPSPSASPSTVTVTQTSVVTATPTPDAAVGAPRLDIACDSSYIVVLASSLNAIDFRAQLDQYLPIYPEAKYLFTGESCFNFTNKSAYALYAGPYRDRASACAARFAGTHDAYVKVSDPAVSATSLSCTCAFRGVELPKLSMDATIGSTTGPYVGEAQHALARIDIYRADFISGNFDAEFAEAVKQLQANAGLAADGIIGADTWDALNQRDC